MWTSEDPIFALSSGGLPSGVGVMRLSGTGVLEIAQSLLEKPLPEPRSASLRLLLDPETKTIIDQALVLIFPAPHSFTGEDVVELHIHGSRAVVQELSRVLDSQGVRPAEAGEFTKRAFVNGQMDLVEADGLADLIHAETEMQRRQALGQMQGGLTEVYEGWRARLLNALALIEAEIDFSNEDIPENLFNQVKPNLEQICSEIQAHLAEGYKGERIRNGVQIAVIGEPNVGKSSLINALAKRDVAIVSDIAGTTRDVIEVHLDIGGFPVTLADTAGLRETGDVIEQEGVRRALKKAEDADLRILMLDARNQTVPADIAKACDERTMILWNKSDLAKGVPENSGLSVLGEWAISAKSGEGVGHWLDDVKNWIKDHFSTGSSVYLTRERYRRSLEDVLESLDRAFVIQEKEPILAAEDVRLAMRALGRITGHVDVEDLLDVVFSEFCIGK
ncbi:MAG: tRNA uridine-5-carboxymethylaminomethyl(34) synthesis GTPase MnmE [Sphingomonadales bacterium]